MAKRTLKIEVLGDNRSATNAMRETADEVDGLGERVSGFASGAGRLAAGAAVGVGGAVVGGLAIGMNEALNRGAIFDQMNAALGASGADAERNAQIAGDLYAGAWGDSLDEVAGAVTSTQQNLAGLVPPDTFELATSRALDFAKVMQEDVGGVSRAVGQLLRTGMVDSAEEAFDLLAAGQTQGLNRSEDLLDTINEYAPAFARLGIDGNQAMGLIGQGLEAGAFNADKIGDAFNEFSIRAIDGSTATADALATLGLNADTVAQQIAQGGPTANAATAEILAALNSVADKVAQDAAGVALFGSMWEDLGAEAILGLDTMNEGLEGTDGAAAALSDTLNDNLATRLESLKRQGLTALADIAERLVIPAIEKMIDVGERVADVWGESGFSGVMSLLGSEISDAWPRIRSTLGSLLSDLGAWIADAAPVIGAQLVEWGREFVEWLLPNIPPFLREVGGFLGAAFDWLVEDGIELAATKLAEFGQAFIVWVAPLIPPLLVEVGKLLFDLGEWIVTDAAPQIGLKLLEWAGEFGAWVGAAALDLLGKLPGLLGQLGLWIVTDAGPAIGRLLGSWTGQFVVWATSLPARIVAGLGNLGQKLWEALKAAWDFMVGKAKSLPTAILKVDLNPFNGGDDRGPKFIPKRHSGGTFHTDAPGGQGLALLADGEEISPGRVTSSGRGGPTTINLILDGRVLGTALEDISRVSALDIRLA